MDVRDDPKTSLAKRVAALLRTDPRFRDFLRFVAPDGSRPVVIAALDDRVGDVFAYLARHHRSGANVVIGSESGRFANIIVRHETEDADSPSFGAISTDCPVHVDAPLGMLMAYLLLHEGEAVRCCPVGDEYEMDVKLEKVHVPA